MKWDDELEQLSTAVVETFGEEALNAAIERAYGLAAIRSQTAPSLGHVAVTGSAPASGSFEECLRAELRRIVRPH
jgi:hypothetical protein